MDTYLDPSLGGPLAFLDSSTQLHAPSDPSNQPLNFDAFDSWLNPVSGPGYEGSQGLSVAHGAPQVAPLNLDSRQSLTSGHFGVHLHSEPRVNAKSNSAPLSPLSPQVHSSGSMHLPFVGSEYPDGTGMFHSRTNLSSQNYVHPSPSAHSEPGTESMSIAMYDRQIGGSGSGSGGGGPSDYSTSLQNLRDPSISSNTSSSSSTVRQTLSPTTSTHSTLARAVPVPQRSPLRSNQGRSPPTTRSKGQKTSQADESVPEAALHLLRLALPTGSTGSAATDTTRDDERSCDEDAEGESDDTSIHSTDLKALGKFFTDANGQPVPFETTVWNHSEGQPPLHVQRGGGPGSRRPSAASSAASTRIRQHNPARTQREASVASARSRLGSEAPSVNAQGSSSSNIALASGPAAAVGRRTTRGRKISTTSGDADIELGAESDGGEGAEENGDESEGEYKEEDGDVTDTGKGKGKKKGGKGGAAAKGKGKATKRASTATDGAPPAKKPRNSRANGPAAPRKPRRQAFIPPNLTNRTFPPGFEISSSFPRFYRAFPISSAVPPDSYVLQLPSGSSHQSTNASSSSSSVQSSTIPPQSLPLDILPTPPTPIYDQHFGFSSHSPYSNSHSPPLTASSSASTSSLPNISVDASGSFVIHDQSHAHQSHPSHAHTHPHYTASYSQSPYSLPPPTPGPPEMAPPSLLQNQAPPSPSTSSSGPFAHLNLMQPPPEARWNKAGDPFNLYYPRLIKGSADDKCGLCPICAEPPERGGQGEHKWLKLKNSSYVYHLSYNHGLSNVTGLPFSPPVEIRVIDLPKQSKDTRAKMTEGRCHKCDEWIPLLSVKNIDAIIPELIWWKHAKKCHGDSTIPGERDPYVVDDLYNYVLARKSESNY
ncbi:hypothetical protein JCM3765_002707 [Sporobolomyces pararoseus]